VDGALAEKVAGTKAIDWKPSRPPRAHRSGASLKAEEEPEEACSRAILRADLFVTSHALVFDFSAVELDQTLAAVWPTCEREERIG
jgi:hypothetical protein